jgi:hypothetical protein
MLFIRGNAMSGATNKLPKQPIMITIMRWAGHVARLGEGSGVYRVLVGKPEGKRPLERPKHRRYDIIKINLQEVGWEYGLD